MGKYTKVHRGQALNISADAYNAFIDSISGESKMSCPEIHDKRQFTVSGFSKTTAFPVYSVVGLEDIFSAPSGEKFPPNFFSKPVFTVVGAKADNHSNKFGITQQVIRAQGAGPVLLSGVTPVRVRRTGSEPFDSAGLDVFDTMLTTNSSGIPILWHEKTNRSGHWCWAFALLGGGSGSKYCIAKVTKVNYQTVSCVRYLRSTGSSPVVHLFESVEFELLGDPLFPVPASILSVGQIVRCVTIDGGWHIDKINY